MNSPPILFFSYARSGGTLMNKCLLNLSNTIVLSEINPNEFGEGLWKKRPYIHEIIQLQVKKWYGIELQSKYFDDALLELINYCANNNIRLIIRDFSIADFVSSPLLQNQPKNQLSWIKWMENHQINFCSFSLIRHPMQVWISHKMPEVNSFISYYKNFLQEIRKHNIPYYYYQSFTRNPLHVLNQILGQLQITQSSASLLNIGNKHNLFGDLKNANHKLLEIKAMSERPIPFWKWKQANQLMMSEPLFNEFFEFQTSKNFDLLMYNTILFYWNKIKNFKKIN